jgi:hypothetical protein
MRCDRSPAPFDVPPESTTHGFAEHCFLVRESAERHRLAAGFADRGGDNRAVAVVDATRTEQLAGLDKFVAGRKHGNPRTAHDANRRKTASGEHPDLARADARASAQ